MLMLSVLGHTNIVELVRIMEASIFMVSEALESKFKVFLAFVCPTTDSINIVGWPRDHLNP